MPGIDFGNLRLGQHICCRDQGGYGPTSANPNIVVGRPYQLIGWSTPSGERVGITNPAGTGLLTIQVGPESRNSRNGWWNLKPSSVELYEDSRGDEQKAQQIHHAQTMLKNIAEMYEYHDVVVVAEGHEMKAPGLLLAAASPVLRAMLTSPMQESQNRRIELRNAGVEAVQECLSYISSGIVSAKGPLLAELAVLADQYNMPSLLRAAMDKMYREVRPDTVAVFMRTLRCLPPSEACEEAYTRLSKKVRETDELFAGLMDGFVPSGQKPGKRVNGKRKLINC